MNFPQTRTVHVVAAVILRPDGAFLLAQRPCGKVYEGYWEFPGGKIEPGELPAEALARELSEELGIEVLRSSPWISRTYRYPHASVHLAFMRVDLWRGEPQPREQQALVWQHPGNISVAPLLPANAPILKALRLPPLYAISCAGLLGMKEFLERLDVALTGGVRLVQVRDKELHQGARRELARAVCDRCHEAGAHVLINDDEELAIAVGADGVHFSARRLREVIRRPPLEWCGASCHDAEELARAAALGMDFAVLGPVTRTPSHPTAIPLGWQRFSELVADSPLPVYALGGQRPEDLQLARSYGAHGLAMMRAAWPAKGTLP